MRELAVINGASGGIGSAIAKELAKQYDLLLLGRNETALKHLVEELSPMSTANYQLVDMHDKASFLAVKDYLISNQVQPSVLVNSTGIVPVGGVLTIEDEQWDDAIQVGLMSAVRLVKQLAPCMASQGGSIVLVNGAFAVQPHPDFVVSAVITGALRTFAKAISTDLAKNNIRVNSVLPGATQTGLWDGISEATGVSVGDLLQEAATSNPLKRVATVNDIAHAVTYLCSPNASYINAASIIIDGGSTMSMG